MSELRECPFCGGEVSIETYENPMPYTNDTGKTLWRDEPEGYVIECKNHKWSNSKHPLAGDLALYSWDTSEESKSALIEAWNTRAERTCENMAEQCFREAYNAFLCSRCGANTAYTNVDYCPNCGAKVVSE